MSVGNPIRCSLCGVLHGNHAINCERNKMTTVHIYCCPECDHVFGVDHPDAEGYADPCPECSYSVPDLVDLFTVDEL